MHVRMSTVASFFSFKNVKINILSVVIRYRHGFQNFGAYEITVCSNVNCTSCFYLSNVIRKNRVRHYYIHIYIFFKEYTYF